MGELLAEAATAVGLPGETQQTGEARHSEEGPWAAVHHLAGAGEHIETLAVLALRHIGQQAPGPEAELDHSREARCTASLSAPAHIC